MSSVVLARYPPTPHTGLVDGTVECGPHCSRQTPRGRSLEELLPHATGVNHRLMCVDHFPSCLPPGVMDGAAYLRSRFGSYLHCVNDLHWVLNGRIYMHLPSAYPSYSWERGIRLWGSIRNTGHGRVTDSSPSHSLTAPPYPTIPQRVNSAFGLRSIAKGGVAKWAVVGDAAYAAAVAFHRAWMGLLLAPELPEAILETASGWLRESTELVEDGPEEAPQVGASEAGRIETDGNSHGGCDKGPCPAGFRAVAGFHPRPRPCPRYVDDVGHPPRGGGHDESDGWCGTDRASTSPDSRIGLDLDLDRPISACYPADPPPCSGSRAVAEAEGGGGGGVGWALSGGLGAVHIAEDAMELDEEECPGLAGRMRGHGGQFEREEAALMAVERVGVEVAGGKPRADNPFERFRIQKTK